MACVETGEHMMLRGGAGTWQADVPAMAYGSAKAQQACQLCARHSARTWQACNRHVHTTTL